MKNEKKIEIHKDNYELFYNKDKRGRNLSIDILRGIAVFIVVLGHVVPPEFFLHKIIYSVNNQLFFMISGYLFMGTWDKYRRCDIIIKKKVKGILIPYVSWSIVAAVVRWMIRSDHSIKELLEWLYTSIIEANGVWFFAALFTIYFICAISLELYKKQKWLGIIPIVFFVFLPNNFFAFENAKKMFVFFGVGFLWSFIGQNPEDLKSKKCAVLTSMALLIAYLFDVLFESIIIDYLCFFIKGICGTIMIYIILVPIISKFIFLQHRVTLYGKESLVLYPITQMFSELIWKAGYANTNQYKTMISGGLVDNMLLMIIVFIFCVFSIELTMLIDYILGKNFLYKVMFKGKWKEK